MNVGLGVNLIECLFRCAKARCTLEKREEKGLRTFWVFI
jgi:hypothetical protein